MIKTRYIIFSLIFLFTYLLSIMSVLYTESFILFLACLCIVIRLFISKKGLFFDYKKDDTRWNETILFYLVFKNWNRSLMRDNNIRIANFLLLSLQMQKYEIEWIKKNLNNIVRRDHILLKQTTLRRLEILVFYKKLIKLETGVFGLRRLPLGNNS